MSLPVIGTVADLRAQVGAWRAKGMRVGLVPTMGALHEGHLSLVRTALDAGADRVVASVFVNPTQFGPNEDFDQYPRQPEQDAVLLENAGAHGMYYPAVSEMYTDDAATTVHVAGITDCLCGPIRPGHFDGVATVVTKLLLQCLPDVAVFGQKDYQQLFVIKRMVADLDIPVQIIGAPIVREPDGLALSSRNAYLSDTQRQTALVLIRTLRDIQAKAKSNPDSLDELCAAGCDAILAAGFDRVDYLEIRDAEQLRPMKRLDRPARVFVAARLGQTRLIDNLAIEPDG